LRSIANLISDLKPDLKPIQNRLKALVSMNFDSLEINLKLIQNRLKTNLKPELSSVRNILHVSA